MSRSENRRTKAASAHADTLDPDMTTRILDAAMARFARQGVGATTMAELARDAGISRAWLYRKFPNRAAVMAALVTRETQRFVVGLKGVSDRELPLSQRVTNAFVYVVSSLRQNPLLQRSIVTDRASLTEYLFDGAAAEMQQGVETIAAALITGAGLRPSHARKVGETFARLVFSILLLPNIGTDFDNPRELRAYAAQVIPALLA